MATTFTLIQTYTLGSAAASIDFTSIPATYTDLCLKLSLRTDYSAIDTYFNMNFNNDTGANYKNIGVYQSNSPVASSNSFTAQNNLYIYQSNAGTSTSNTFANVEIYIPNYATSSTYKSVSADGANENNTASPTTRFNPLNGGLWSSSAPITSIKFTPPSGNWLTYSSASLYGILKA